MTLAPVIKDCRLLTREQSDAMRWATVEEVDWPSAREERWARSLFSFGFAA